MPTERPVVVVVVKGLGLGGAEKLISEGARFWDRDAFDYRVAFVLPWKDQLVAELDDSGIPVACVGSSRGFDPTTPSRLRELLRSWRADLVHAHLPTTGVLARLVSPCPVVYTEHNLASSYRLLSRLSNRATYRRNAAVTAVSEAVAASLAGYPGPTPELIRNGVSVRVGPADAGVVRSELDLASGESLVVHVGNIRPGKGHRTLIEAARHLVDHRPEVAVVTVGAERDPGDLQRLRNEIADAGLAEKMRALGRRDDALAVIAAADVYVNPADVEGLPVTILEAMALGRPVVATAVGGLPGLIDDGVNGRLVPPGRPEELAFAIRELLDDRLSAERLGNAARRLVEAEYGLEAMVHSMETIYRRVLT